MEAHPPEAWAHQIPKLWKCRCRATRRDTFTRHYRSFHREFVEEVASTVLEEGVGSEDQEARPAETRLASTQWRPMHVRPVAEPPATVTSEEVAGTAEEDV